MSSPFRNCHAMVMRRVKPLGVFCQSTGSKRHMVFRTSDIDNREAGRMIELGVFHANISPTAHMVCCKVIPKSDSHIWREKGLRGYRD